MLVMVLLLACAGEPPPKPPGDCTLVCNGDRWQWVCEPRNPYGRDPDKRNPY